MQLAMLMIVAPDLARARDFYGATLGFELKSETPQRLVPVHERADIVIFKGSAHAAVSKHGVQASTTFVFATASLDRSMESLKAKGVELLHDTPAHNEFGRYAAFRDPFGNVLELLERGPHSPAQS